MYLLMPLRPNRAPQPDSSPATSSSQESHAIPDVLHKAPDARSPPAPGTLPSFQKADTGSEAERQIKNLRSILANIAPDPELESSPSSFLLSSNTGSPSLQQEGALPCCDASAHSLNPLPVTPAHRETVETMVGKGKSKRPEPALSSADTDEGTRVAAKLTYKEVQFVISVQEKVPPSIEMLRDRITKQHPFLLHRFEPEPKVRKPHENPPAVDKAVRARFKPISSAESKALLESLQVSVESMTEQSVVRGVILLERRTTYWKQLGVVSPSQLNGAFGPLKSPTPLPSAWLLPISSARCVDLAKAKSKKTLRLLDFEGVTGCKACSATGRGTCPTCCGVPPDECFWCDGTGTRKHKTCNNCKGRKVLVCLRCDSVGKAACMACGGQGYVFVGAFVEMNWRNIYLPPIAAKDLTHPDTGLPPATGEEVALCARLQMARTIEKLTQSEATKDAPSVPVLARCVWQKSVKRTVRVWKPKHVAVPSHHKLARPHVPGLSHTTKQKGDLHRFLVSSDKTAPILEISSSTSQMTGASTHSVLPPASASLPPSAFNTPSASVANLHSIWRISELEPSSSPSPISPNVPLTAPAASSPRPGPGLIQHSCPTVSAPLLSHSRGMSEPWSSARSWSALGLTTGSSTTPALSEQAEARDYFPSATRPAAASPSFTRGRTWTNFLSPIRRKSQKLKEESSDTFHSSTIEPY